MKNSNYSKGKNGKGEVGKNLNKNAPKNKKGSVREEWKSKVPDQLKIPDFPENDVYTQSEKEASDFKTLVNNSIFGGECFRLKEEERLLKPVQVKGQHFDVDYEMFAVSLPTIEFHIRHEIDPEIISEREMLGIRQAATEAAREMEKIMLDHPNTIAVNLNDSNCCPGVDAKEVVPLENKGSELKKIDEGELDDDFLDDLL